MRLLQSLGAGCARAPWHGFPATKQLSDETHRGYCGCKTQRGQNEQRLCPRAGGPRNPPDSSRVARTNLLQTAESITINPHRGGFVSLDMYARPRPED